MRALRPAKRRPRLPLSFIIMFVGCILDGRPPAFKPPGRPQLGPWIAFRRGYLHLIALHDQLEALDKSTAARLRKVCVNARFESGEDVGGAQLSVLSIILLQQRNPGAGVLCPQQPNLSERGVIIAARLENKQDEVTAYKRPMHNLSDARGRDRDIEVGRAEDPHKVLSTRGRRIDYNCNEGGLCHNLKLDPYSCINLSRFWADFVR